MPFSAMIETPNAKVTDFNACGAGRLTQDPLPGRHLVVHMPFAAFSGKALPIRSSVPFLPFPFRGPFEPRTRARFQKQQSFDCWWGMSRKCATT